MKQRESSIELLRCIAIIMIMAVHAGYYTFGTPTPEGIRAAPTSNFLYILYENINIICVDVFLLISGWFGINTKLKSIGGFIFQILFFSFGGALLGYLFTGLNFSASVLDICIGLFQEDFISSYIFMYALTPVMNAYICQSNTRQMGIMLAIFFFIIFSAGLLCGNPNLQGKSILTFCALYMLGRYTRIHTVLPHWKARTDFMIWAAILVGMTSTVWLSAYNGHTDRLSNIMINMSTSYINPLVILMSLFVLLFFTRFHFYNSFINWCGISSFAVVLFHCWVFAPGESVEGFANVVRHLFTSFDIVPFLTIMPLLFITLFISAVIIDKARLRLWNAIYNTLNQSELANRGG